MREQSDCSVLRSTRQSMVDGAINDEHVPLSWRTSQAIPWVLLHAPPRSASLEAPAGRLAERHQHRHPRERTQSAPSPSESTLASGSFAPPGTSF